jgi:hypothetical protein
MFSSPVFSVFSVASSVLVFVRVSAGPHEGRTETSGMSSTTAGMETPEAVELRKRSTIEAAMDDT